MSQKSNRPELLQRIEALIDNLTAINDKSGQYLQRLADGRVIDTKGWEGWEWTHGIGLFGLFRYQQLTGSPRARQLIDDWFSARFAEGTPEKNINTACPFLTLALRYQHAHVLAQGLHVVAHAGLLGSAQGFAAALAGDVAQQGAVVVI